MKSAGYFLKRIFGNPYLIFVYMSNYGLLNWMPDKPYLKLNYRGRIGKKLDLNDPKDFNEKLQYLKLNDRKPQYTDMVDKYEVKKYIAEKIGEKYIIPTLGVWDSFDEIDFDLLPEQFVLKCTHDSGGLVIVRSKSEFDRKSAKRKIEKSLKRNYYHLGREWPYKNVKPRIIAEQYISDESTVELADYKFFCFNGEAKVILVCTERFSEGGLKEDFFDEKWVHLDMKRSKHGNSERSLPPPHNLQKMLELSRQLSENIPFVRVDFYEVKDHLYFGEMTFFPAGGMERFEPQEWDRKLGDWLDISGI